MYTGEDSTNMQEVTLQTNDKEPRKAEEKHKNASWCKKNRSSDTN